MRHCGIWQLQSRSSLESLKICQSPKFGKFKLFYFVQRIILLFPYSNDLIVEISRDDPSRRNFYFSTQLAFGCVQLYRHQIEKLLSKIVLNLFNSRGSYRFISFQIKLRTHASHVSLHSTI